MEQDNKPTAAGILAVMLAAVMQFFNFDGLTFFEKWTRIALTAVLVPVLLDALPGYLPISISALCWVSLLSGIAGFIILLALYIIKDYEERQEKK